MKKFLSIFKKVLYALGVFSSAALFFVVLTSSVKKQDELICKDLTVKVDYDSGLSFLNEKEITGHLNFFNGKNLSGQRISQINLASLEHELDKNPFVDKAQVFIDQSHIVIVEVKQKRPILRILNSDGVGYYMSEKNERIPLCDKFTAHVPLAVGEVETYVNEKRDSVMQSALYRLVQYVRTDEFLNALTDQVYVHGNGELDLVPKINGHIIRFGRVDKSMEEKFSRLKIFYKEGFEKIGWSKYKAIDLRYKNQVVCEKVDANEHVL